MTDEEFSALLACEEQKRAAAWDPLERWKAIQAAIDWAESQATVRRNTPARCIELERAKLAGNDEVTK
jgi:hypothetical protein